jgi:type II secretion system protein J
MPATALRRGSDVVAGNLHSEISNLQSRRDSCGGFTLLEVLVATALIAVISVTLYASLSTAFKARRSALAATSDVRRTDLAMELLSADVRSAVVPNGTLAGTFVGEDYRDSSGGDSDLLTFCCTTPSPEPGVGIGDIRKVQFGCEPSADGRSQILYRLTTTNLLSPKDVEPQREVLCRGVAAFNLRYYDGTWQDYWDSTELSNVLPYVIEVTIELVDPNPRSATGGGYRTSQLLILPCAPVPSNSTSTTSTSGTSSSSGRTGP